MDHAARLGSFLLAIVAFTLPLACSGSSQYERVPIEEARALNSHVSAFYSGTQQLIEEANRQVNAVGELPQGIRPADFEIQLVKNALISCFNTPIAVTQVSNEAPRGVVAELGDDPLRPLTARPDLDNVAFCNPTDMISLESYIEYAPENISRFISDRVLMVDVLRVNLKHVLQERTNLLEEYVQDAQTQAVRLRDTARQRYEQTMASDDASSEQQMQTQADYEQIQAELDDIERLLARVQDDLTEMRRFRRQLVEDVVVHLTAMGTPQS